MIISAIKFYTAIGCSIDKYYTNLYGPVMKAIRRNMDLRQQYSPRSILLQKIHKTHIARHHMSIFALLYVKCLWFKHIGLWIHILLDSP